MKTKPTYKLLLGDGQRGRALKSKKIDYRLRWRERALRNRKKKLDYRLQQNRFVRGVGERVLYFGYFFF